MEFVMVKNQVVPGVRTCVLRFPLAALLSDQVNEYCYVG